MKRTKKFDKYDFLNLFYQEMLRTGYTYNLVRLSVNSRMVEICDKSSVLITKNELQTIANICLANNWLEPTSICADQYSNLQLTKIGLGVVKSKQMQAELLNNRSTLKKASDYIEEHKGLFILLSFIITTTWLLIKFFYGSNING